MDTWSLMDDDIIDPFFVLAGHSELFSSKVFFSSIASFLVHGTISGKPIKNDRIVAMWLKQCHKPALTGNGNHTTYRNGDFPGGW